MIVGGGTAGWLAALLCSKILNADDRASQGTEKVKITVVESSQIPTLGVGEGTTAVFASVLYNLGIDEKEFLAETGATLKFGIKHRDWLRPGFTYDGPIDDPNQLAGIDGIWPWLDITAIGSGSSVSRHRLFYYLLNLDKAHLAQRKNSELIAVGPFQHAYHFDQAKVGKFLKKKASDVEHIDANIADCEFNERGDIAHLVTETGDKIEGDFFLDCTGFKRVLTRLLAKDSWVSYKDALPVNRAMPFWLPHNASGKISAYTLAWAQRCGWMWMIPTQDRIGCGYVYCDEFTNPEQAQAEIESALGTAIEPRADLRYDTGRLKENWNANCLALGLASSFLEPLEATSIHATVVQLLLLLQHHLEVDRKGVKFVRQSEFNRVVAQQLDDFKQFINIHYSVERDDSPFWQYVTEKCITRYNRERIDHWKTEIPSYKEFNSLAHNLPHMEASLYYPVLDGLGLLKKDAAKNLLSQWPKERKLARQGLKNLTHEYRKAAGQALDHAKFLKSL